MIVKANLYVFRYVRFGFSPRQMRGKRGENSTAKSIIVLLSLLFIVDSAPLISLQIFSIRRTNLNLRFIFAPAEPGSAPRNVQVRPLSSSTMVIQWDEPETPNGQVTVSFRKHLPFITKDWLSLLETKACLSSRAFRFYFCKKKCIIIQKQGGL